MADDLFLLDLPIYKPVYAKEKKYGFYGQEKKNTLALLTDLSHGYCMYCFNRIVINGNHYGQIEHGIERKIAKQLVNCVPNLGLACSKCNQSYKSIGEKQRKLTPNQIEKLKECTCNAGNCKEICDTFSTCRKYYMKKWKIILQPFGYQNRNKVLYKIQFNLLTGEYIPNENELYSEEDKSFIEAHIKFFGLNDVARRNKELAIYCKNVIAEQSILDGITVNHLIVELFRKKLAGIPLEKAIRICEIVYNQLLLAQYT